MADHLFQRRFARRVLHAGRVVWGFEKAIMESAGLDFRTGLDGALRDDGGGRVAGLETRRIRRATPTAHALSRAIGAERPLDAALFWTALDGRGLCGDRVVVAGHWRNPSFLPSHQSHRRVVARTVSRLGEFCRRVKF